jgi:hypothetical protein
MRASPWITSTSVLYQAHATDRKGGLLTERAQQWRLFTRLENRTKEGMLHTGFSISNGESFQCLYCIRCWFEYDDILNGTHIVPDFLISSSSLECFIYKCYYSLNQYMSNMHHVQSRIEHQIHASTPSTTRPKPHIIFSCFGFAFHGTSMRRLPPAIIDRRENWRGNG